MNNQAYNILKRSPVNKTKEINLSNLKISFLSEDIVGFYKLTTLNLFNNKLSELSSFFSTLENLENLNLGNNIFKLFPEAITNMPIKSLNLSSNKLSDLGGIEKLALTLQKLELSSNKLVNLRTDFSRFEELKYLNLSGNEIKKFPKSIKCETLRTLNLSNNQIRLVPNSISSLKGLVELDLSYNYIEKLPEEIGELTNLRVLKLTGNNIKELPKSLANLKKLKELILTGNPIGLPPIEVANQGVTSMINYYLHIGQFVRLNEAKLLIVGQGNVGKTCLLNKVVHGAMPTGESTRGIDIVPWIINDTNNNPVRINFWDFGGQEIYHATHQFFLTQRSVYIFVWEARKDENILHFDYWLNIIKTLSNSSPVLVVMNKVDDRSIEIDEKSLKEAFPNVAHFIKTSAKSGTGIEELSIQIKNKILSLPHIGDKLPKVWNDIRLELESYSLNYVTFDKYIQVCAKFGLDNNEAKILSKYLHDLGAFIHFSDNKTLKTLVFLKSEWVTNSVYKILDIVEVAKKKGLFNLSLLESNLPDLTHDEINYILVLMEKFELCFELKSDKYIIPELLSPTAPEHKDENLISGISLSYQYDFMPAGIVTRLTVRLKDLIFKDFYWKNGVYFNHNNTLAIVESKDIQRTINIKLSGENQAVLLEIIKKELDQINYSLNNPLHKILLKCNCKLCKLSHNPFMFEYDYLIRAKKKFHTIPCQKSLNEVDISSLIGPYDVSIRIVKSDLIYNPDSLLFDIVEIATRLTERKYTVTKEDLVTDNFTDQLRSKGYIVADQSRSGRSSSGITSGETDIMIRDSRGLPISIIESLRLDTFGMGNSTIIEHLTKLQVDYDTTGLPVNFMIIYSESEDYNEAWIKYKKYIDQLPQHRFYDPKTLELTNYGVKEELSRRNNIKVLYTSHSNESNKQRDVYHIFVNLNTKIK